MTPNRPERFRCRGCKTIVDATDVLTAPNPFEPSESIQGCPTCRSVDQFTLLCDEFQCDREASCGTPTASGYRQTCGEHRPIPGGSSVRLKGGLEP